MVDFSKARQVHRQCTNLVHELKGGLTFDAFEEKYREALHGIQRIYNKTKNAMKGHPRSSSLMGKYIHDRDTDPLLLYFKQARNSDEHTVDELTRRDPSGIAIGPQRDATTFYVEHLEVRNGKILSYRGDPAKVTAIPARVVPITVKTRDGVYQAPKLHLGTSIDGQTLEQWLELALGYYDRMLTDLEKNA